MPRSLIHHPTKIIEEIKIFISFVNLFQNFFGFIFSIYLKMFENFKTLFVFNYMSFLVPRF